MRSRARSLGRRRRRGGGLLSVALLRVMAAGGRSLSRRISRDVWFQIGAYVCFFVAKGISLGLFLSGRWLCSSRVVVTTFLIKIYNNNKECA